MPSIQGYNALGNLVIQVSKEFLKESRGFLLTIAITTIAPNISNYKIWIIIRHTQVLFTWWVRKSSYSCCLETVLIQLIANHSVSTLSHTINSMVRSPPNNRLPPPTLPSRMPPVGFHSCSMPGANSPSQLITEFLMECFPSGWGPSQRGLQSVLLVKLLWLPEYTPSFGVTADVC